MLHIPVPVSHRTPGLRWKQHKDGSYSGALYTTWPLRLRTRFKPMKYLAWVVSVLGFAVTESTFGDRMMMFCAAWIYIFVYIYPAFVLWPFWPLTKSVRMTPTHLIIGMRRFKLSEMSAIATYEAGTPEGSDAYCIGFHYGWRIISIEVRNPAQHGLNIAETLNATRAALLEPTYTYEQGATAQQTSDRAPMPTGGRVSAF
ncbi:MAG: hypothetical protein AAF224_09450 [Pseudomonadota bacterium]